MTGLIIHERTQQLIGSMLKAAPHAILLTGDCGVGLKTIAVSMAEQLSGNRHWVRLVEPDEKGTITIEVVRNLYISTRMKQNEMTVIVIDDVDAMSLPAQNAFLKLLEEPTTQTTFILTSHQPQTLLPTVRSRVQAIDAVRVSAEKSKKFIESKNIKDAMLARQLLFLASGRPALLHRLIHDKKLQERYLDYARSAKAFISGKAYERIIISSKIANDRESSLIILETAAEMLRLQLGQTIDTQAINLLDRIIETYQRITANGNVKAQLLNLCF